MPVLGRESESMLVTCHPNIIRVMRSVILLIDYKVIFGHRGVEIQQQLFAAGRSTLDGITKKSEHNFDPSRAIDIAPWPVLWPDEENISDEKRAHRVKRFHMLAGIVLGVGHALDVPLIWGGDWDHDFTYNDQTFHDLGHFQLRKAA